MGSIPVRLTGRGDGSPAGRARQREARVWTGLLVVAALLAPGGELEAGESGTPGGALPPWAAEQVPTDTIRPPAPAPDTLVGRILPDTLLPPGLREADPPRIGELEVPVDLEALVAEAIPRIARAPHGVRAGFGRGVWEWTGDELQDVRAITLAELLDEVPGVTLLRGGDHGQPTTATAFGMGPERIRVFRDGMELPPLDGGGVDLSRVGLAALESVRVERRAGELRIELRTLRLFDTRPYTLLEVGTGDLNTNLFRGTFGHPDVLGGHFLIALDRVDTQGPFRAEPGASFGTALAYTWFFRDRLALTWDLRRMSSRRPEELWTPRNVHRSDNVFRAAMEVADGLVVEAFHQRSALSLDPEVTFEHPGWIRVDQEPRRQLGADVSLDRDVWWFRGGVRRQGGEGWPTWVQSASAGVDLPVLGGVSGGVERESWDGRTHVGFQARAWTRPLLGISLFAEVEDGRRGVPRFVPPTLPDLPDEEENGENGENGEEENGDPPPPPLGPPSFAGWTGLRAGAELRTGDLRLGVAGVRIRGDTLHPTGLPMDRGATPVPGEERFGVEVSGRIPLAALLQGLALEGSLQMWEAGGPWPYLPRHTHDARLSFHDVFLESRNLEVWADVGVRGRDGMIVFLSDPDENGEIGAVPSFQSWFARIQVRVVTARIFLEWENFTIRDQNQDFPGRVLPPTRTLFGVRWTMWN